VPVAPELLNSDDLKTRYNSAVDVYSFGIILNAMWRRCKPYNAEAFGSILHLLQSVKDGVRPIVPDDMPPWLRQMMVSCWEGEAARRLSACDICEVFERHASTEPFSSIDSRASAR
jgi:hypothetical protein